MKISELKNAPQWLLDAATELADVDCDAYGRVMWHGGEWHGGVWRGGVWCDGVWCDGVWCDGVWCDGEWRGGVWCGGVWRGGVWRGGVWCDGVWCDGVWCDGVWRGGVWCGGVWHGGEWHGGVWRGGVWRGGVWRGEKCVSNLWTVFGLAWPVTISPTRMQIGCELHSFSGWAGFDDERIVKMDRGALKFWRTHKAALMALCGARPPAKEGK